MSKHDRLMVVVRVSVADRAAFRRANKSHNARIRFDELAFARGAWVSGCAGLVPVCCEKDGYQETSISTDAASKVKPVLFPKRSFQESVRASWPGSHKVPKRKLGERFKKL
jgi:hypothetical protein